MSDSLKIIYKDNDVIIVEKPVGMPSQSDPTGAPDAMSVCSGELKKSGERSELWLVHRLDRTVGGLIAFARTKAAAAELCAIASGSGMDKRYFAICHGAFEGGELHDFLYKDSAAGKAYVVKTQRRGAKEAVLHATAKAHLGTDATLLSVKLQTGRFHQIRVQLASRTHPLIGDKKYGSRDAVSKTPALFAYRLEFSLIGKRVCAEVLPNTESYPWSLFKNEYYRSNET